jgi:Domain of unknown function (DUF5615)
MNQLFIELYLDEDVNVLIANILQGQGFTALTTRDAGMLKKKDAEQLAFAASQQKTLLTHNRADFEKLFEEYSIAGQNHAGIIVVFRRPPYELVQKLLPILNQITADEMVNQIIYI